MEIRTFTQDELGKFAEYLERELAYCCSFRMAAAALRRGDLGDALWRIRSDADKLTCKDKNALKQLLEVEMSRCGISCAHAKDVHDCERCSPHVANDCVRFAEVREWLEKTGIFPGCDVLNYEEHMLCVESFQETFGEKATRFFMDCFTPCGKPIDPGIDDSLSLYEFNPESWDELEAEWNS